MHFPPALGAAAYRPRATQVPDSHELICCPYSKHVIPCGIRSSKSNSCPFGNWNVMLCNRSAVKTNVSDASPSTLRTIEAFLVNVATGTPQFMSFRLAGVTGDEAVPFGQTRFEGSDWS